MGSLNVTETAELFSKIWQIHPFREGNTETVLTFATQFAGYHGFRMDKALRRENVQYVRDALVKASDGLYFEYECLICIVKDAIWNG